MMTSLYTNNRYTHSDLLIWILVFAALCLCTAFADFSTKGEPREALVAVNMLNSSNWILPIDASGDMAYKPPMFHWLAALFSLPFGKVSEFTSRLPSVLSLTVLLALTAHFFANKHSRNFGLLCAAFTLTCFEVLRAGTVARVDMVLTVFIIGAMYALYYSRQSGRSILYFIIAVLCMSGGCLTKGPVAIVLPLGAYWVWRLCISDNFFKVTAISALLTVMSLLLPLAWYYAAWKQGGDTFLTLALEENFGRFTGSMSYESHVKPLWYNFTSLLSGSLPWSAAIVIALCFRPVRNAIKNSCKRIGSIKNLWKGVSMQSKFALIAAAFVFVFYCVPKSKRSVYLLPMYPFIAYSISCFVCMLAEHKIITIKHLKRTLTGVIILLAAGFGVAFPIISKTGSDKVKAEQISAVVPDNKTIYTFLPDRFMRFYNIDFYLDGSLVSLLPSGQTSVIRDFDASMMRIPEDKEFYLLTTTDITQGDAQADCGLHLWLENNGMKAEQVYESMFKCRDVKGKAAVLKISKL